MGLGALKNTDSILPEPYETELAIEARDKLITLINKKEKIYDLEIVKNQEGEKTKIRIPLSALEFFFEILKQMANGNAITIIPSHAQLTTQESANFLNVSRPFLIKLLNEGKIPYTKVGRHRRIKFDDILKFKNTFETESKKTREELTKEAQDLNLG